MRYLIAILCPPLAILLCGKLFTAIGNGVLWLICIPFVFAGGIGVVGWLVLMAHAWIVTANYKAMAARARTGRLVAAIVAAITIAPASAAELTPEKAYRYVEAEELATARQIEMYQEMLAGSRKGSKRYKDDVRAIREYQSGKRFAPPTLESREIGTIGAVSIPDERGFEIVAKHREMLRLETRFESFEGNVIEGYGDFYLRNYPEKFVSGNRYRPRDEVLEVVGTAEDGLPILEPFDAEAARKMVKAKVR